MFHDLQIRLGALALLALCACSSDFDSFSFQVDAAQQDSSDASTTSMDASSTAPGASVDGGPDTNDATTDLMDATSSGAEEAGPFEEAGGGTTCPASLGPSVPATKPTCLDCGCDECDQPIANCLDNADSAKAELCRAVLECALENDCRGWTCRCDGTPCGGMVSVDGPCADAYEQATGGGAITEDEVIALLELADPGEPLVQALDAIECIVGLHSKSVGGGADGLCQVECF